MGAKLVCNLLGMRGWPEDLALFDGVEQLVIWQFLTLVSQILVYWYVSSWLRFMVSTVFLGAFGLICIVERVFPVASAN